MDVDVHSYLPEDLLAKVDVATMAHSLEARSPLLDHQVMEFAATLPARFKARGLQKKWLLRKAYRGRVPDSILDGTKKGFGVPLAHWFRAELRDYASSTLRDSSSAVRDYLRGDAIDSLLDAHQEGRGDNSFRIWALLQLELWHRQTG